MKEQFSSFSIWGYIMKEELRKEYKIIRESIMNKNLLDEEIFKKVVSDREVLKHRLVLIYVSTFNEVSTLKLINYFLKIKQVAVPKIENDIMNFYYITSLSELKAGTFNILEPTNRCLVTNYSDAVIITPGICFDVHGYRIGYGKGFYDKFFSRHDNLYKVGLCYDECLIEDTLHDEFDVPVDKIITPSKMLVKMEK